MGFNIEIDSCGDYFCCRYWEVDAVDYIEELSEAR